MITLVFSSVDGWRSRKVYKTLQGAQKAAWLRLGRHPEIGAGYAISGDGVCKVYVSGCSLWDLFPESDAVRENNQLYGNEFRSVEWKPRGAR